MSMVSKYKCIILYIIGCQNDCIGGDTISPTLPIHIIIIIIAADRRRSCNAAAAATVLFFG